jgi:uncharacterized repeat protein (TIGR03803 family)
MKIAVRSAVGIALLIAVPVLVAAPASATTITTVHKFNDTNGGFPGKIVVTGTGTIIGTTQFGGANGNGTIYSIDSAGTFTSLHSFAGVTGGQPNVGGAFPSSLGLAVNASGTIFGTTAGGGANGSGVLYSLSSSGTFTTLRNFDPNGNSNNGNEPTGLIIDGNGRLYGSTIIGGNINTGVLFSQDPGGAVTTGKVPTNGSLGRGFNGALAVDSAGTLFATTFTGGATDAGTLVSMSSNGTVTKLHDFSGTNSTPGWNMTIDSTGTLFGVSYGVEGDGISTVWSRTSAGVFTTLLSFTNGEDASGLYLDSQGTLFGTTIYGGTSNQGTLWSRTSSGVFSTLASFTGDLAGPAWGLASDGRGKLFGVTRGGFSATDEFGSVWSYDTGVIPEPASWAMLIAGFGLTGATMRRRRAIAARA